MQDRLASARHVSQRIAVADEPPATALGDERQQIGERLAEPQGDHVGARLQHRQVEFGRVAGRQVHEPVSSGEPCGCGNIGVRFGVEMAERQHDLVDDQLLDRGRIGLRLQPDHLTSVGPVANVGRSTPVDDDLDLGWQARQDLAVEPVEIDRLDEPRRERHRADRPDLVDQRRCRQLGERVGVDRVRPLVQRRPGPDRPVALHAGIGEQGDVLGHRVHPEPGVQIGAPHASGAGSVRIDEMDAYGSAADELGSVRREPLEQCRGGRAGADQRHLHDGHVAAVLGRSGRSFAVRASRRSSRSGHRTHPPSLTAAGPQFRPSWSTFLCW